MWGDAGTIDAMGYSVGTVILHVTVAQAGFSNTVYTVTITRTLVKPPLLTSLTYGTQSIGIDNFTLQDDSVNSYAGTFVFPEDATLTGLTLSGTSDTPEAEISISQRFAKPVTLPGEYSFANGVNYTVTVTVYGDGTAIENQSSYHGTILLQ